MRQYTRTLRIDLPPGQPAFLRGPRKTGKSTLLRHQLPHSAFFDLLDTRLLLELTRAPWTLSERVRALGDAATAHPIVIDEVQNEGAPRQTSDGIRILPWQQFLELLWSDAIVE